LSLDNICFTGDAIGADAVFAECAKKAGHTVVSLSAEKIIPCDTLKEVDAHVILANKKLKRTFPSRNEHTNNLIRRNFWQVSMTHRVYAVAPLQDDYEVKGGTAWAVQMALDMDVPEVYVFDLQTNTWFYWFYNFDWGYGTFSAMKKPVPKPHGYYTGIGSRKLTKRGKKEIEALYE
jgi:hypothetical protein